MAKVYIEDVRELVEKAGEIRKKLALGTRRIGNVHIGGPMSATDVTVALYYKYLVCSTNSCISVFHCKASFSI